MKTVTREERLGKLRAWYAQRGREGKSRLLNEVCEEYGYSRKHAIKLLRDPAAAALWQQLGRQLHLESGVHGHGYWLN